MTRKNEQTALPSQMVVFGLVPSEQRGHAMPVSIRLSRGKVAEVAPLSDSDEVLPWALARAQDAIEVLAIDHQGSSQWPPVIDKTTMPRRDTQYLSEPQRMELHLPDGIPEQPVGLDAVPEAPRRRLERSWSAWRDSVQVPVIGELGRHGQMQHHVPEPVTDLAPGEVSPQPRAWIESVRVELVLREKASGWEVAVESTRTEQVQGQPDVTHEAQTISSLWVEK